MSTNKTPNLKLHSWLPLDPFSREEINDNFAGLDTAWGDLEGRLLTEAETRANAVAAEATARQTADSTEATTRANADSALRTDLTAAQNNIKSLQTAVAKCGNCQIVYGTYKGTSSAQTLNFTGKPLCVIVRITGESDQYHLFALNGVTSTYTSFSGTRTATLSWGAKSLTIGTSDFTASSCTYCYIALIAMD